MKIVKISVWYGCLIRNIFLSQVGSAAYSFNLSQGLFYFWFLWLELNKMGLVLDPDGDASPSGPAANI